MGNTSGSTPVPVIPAIVRAVYSLNARIWPDFRSCFSRCLIIGPEDSVEQFVIALIEIERRPFYHLPSRSPPTQDKVVLIAKMTWRRECFRKPSHMPHSYPRAVANAQWPDSEVNSNSGSQAPIAWVSQFPYALRYSAPTFLCNNLKDGTDKCGGTTVRLIVCDHRFIAMLLQQANDETGHGVDRQSLGRCWQAGRASDRVRFHAENCFWIYRAQPRRPRSCRMG